MPGAITKGLLARNAIHKDPIADAMQVARKTALFQMEDLINESTPSK